MPTGLVDLLEEHSVEFRRSGEHKHAREGWVQVQCPHCGAGHDGNAFRLGLSLEGWAANCWVCGKQPLYDVLEQLTGLTRQKLRAALGGSEGGKTAPSRRSSAPTAVEMPKGRGKLLPAHVHYLQGRGYDVANLVHQWGIEGLGLGAAPALAWRVLIPIHNAAGKVVSWTARSIKPSTELRYLSASEAQEAQPHKQLLYGEHLARRHAVVAVEGPFDVWRVGSGCVGLFGTAYTPQQVQRLAQYEVVAVCFDHEPKAQRAAKALADELTPLVTKVLRIELDAKDPGTASAKEIRLLRQTIGI